MPIIVEHYESEIAIQSTYNLFAFPVVVRDTDIPELIKKLEVQLKKEAKIERNHT
jgi:hypothetical protein